MSEKAKIVFISSTFEDLKSYRNKIWDLLGNYDVNIRGMEKFGARKETTLSTCLTEVEQCDIFIAIIAFRLGSIDESSGKSFTQREYERAFELKKEILIYLADEKDYKVSPQYIDFEEKREKLISFKSILKERHTVDSFVSENDLGQKVKRKFDELLSQKIDEKAIVTDEYTKSKDIISKFLLLPKLYSGQEIKFEVDFTGEPFPASKNLCSNFNLGYGETVGMSIKINKPEIDEDSIPYVFISRENVTEYFNLRKHKNIEILGKLQFSENEIDNMKANFVRRTYYKNPSILSAMTSLTSIAASAWTPVGTMLESNVIEADGAVIIKLTKIVA